MRIVGGAKDLVIGLQIAGVDRQIGLPEDNRPGFAQARHRPGVFLGDKLRKLRSTGSRSHTRGLERILDRDRHSVQRTTGFATCERGIGGVRLPSSPLGVDRDYAVDWRVERRDTHKEIFNGLPTRYLAPADSPG